MSAAVAAVALTIVTPTIQKITTKTTNLIDKKVLTPIFNLVDGTIDATLNAIDHTVSSVVGIFT